MKTSENGKNLIREFEGLRLTAYKDVNGIKTIGYGHTGKNLPDKITKAQAESYLTSDITKAEKAVNKYGYGYTQNQFDALVSFAFNIGNIDQLTANGTRTLDIVGEKIQLYVYSGGKKVQGLVNRRLKEYNLFMENSTDTDVRKYNYQNAYNFQLSKNFQVCEFVAKSSPLREMYEKGRYTTVLIDDKLVSYLQKIRDYYNKPIIITSGYRPEDYNRSVNGATSSLHIQGKASDIKINGISPTALAKYCKSIGIKGIGTYKDFVHIDTRDIAYYWNG